MNKADGAARLFPIVLSGFLFANLITQPLYSVNSKSIKVSYDANGNLLLTNIRPRVSSVSKNRIVVDELSLEKAPEEILMGCKLPKLGVQYYKQIKNASLEFGIPMTLIAAVIKAESGFNPNALSRKGAQGLMQLMPRTAGDLGVKDPFDPEENIKGGVKYLKWLEMQLGKDYKKILAGYNAGITRVPEWENIEETKQYVKRVMRYWKEFQQEID